MDFKTTNIEVLER